MLSMLCALLLSSSLYAGPKAMDRDQVARFIQQQYGGKILDLKTIKTGSGSAYRIKLLQPSGRVKLMLIDAQDGKQRIFKTPTPKD